MEMHKSGRQIRAKYDECNHSGGVGTGPGTVPAIPFLHKFTKFWREIL